MSSRALTPQQRRALAFQETAESCLVLRVRGADAAAIDAALQRVCRRHQALRIAICEQAGYRLPRQVLIDTAPLAAQRSLQQGPTWTRELQALPQHQWRLELRFSAVCADAVSLANFASALAAEMTGAAVDADAVLQYGEYSDWLAELRQNETAAAGRDWWRRQVAIVAPSPRLPYRRAAASLAGSAGGSERYAMPAAVTAGIARLAQSLGIASADVVQALWWSLLVRIDGRGCIAAAWRHDSRGDYDEMRVALGCYERELPLHLELDLQRRVTDWVADFAAHLQSARDWQEHWPLEGEAEPAAAACVFQELRRPSLPSELSLEDWQWPLAGCELRLCWCEGEAAELRLDYSGAHYDTAAAATLLTQFVCLLRAAPDHAGTLAQLPLMNDADAAALLRRYDAAQGYDEALLPQRIAAHARTQPQAIALATSYEQIDYAELEQRVAAMAAALRSYGLEPEDRVVLLLPPGADLVIALLAVWRAGAAYVPLDLAWPASRLELLIADADPALLLSVTTSARGLAPGRARLDIDVLPPLAGDGEAPENTAAARAAYLLYTSGSSGRPKGVIVEHGALNNYVLGVCDALQLDRYRRFALVSSIATDLGNTVLFGALACGATLCLAEAEAVRDARRFAVFMRRHAVDCLKIVPSHLSALLEEAQAAALPAGCLILGGEATTGALLQRIRRLAPRCRIVNHYGPTETTVGVLVHEHGLADGEPSLAPDETLPLSRVLPNNRVLILDATLRLVPVGIDGELYIGGDNLARGYLDRDDEQARAFVADPADASRRLYRTGDRARYRTDGAIQLAGRIDDQLKINGYRIEPGEVEAVLSALPGVTEAAVIVRRGGTQPQLAAYAGGSGIDAQTLRDGLLQRLPAAMLPASLRVLPALPRLVNGKIDRQTLAQLQIDSSRPHLAPRNELERVLASLWCELLMLDRVSVDADFFDLGGQSLLAIRLSSRIRRVLQAELAPGVVFEQRTVADLAALLSTHQTAARRAREILASFEARQAGAA